jgi:hypothetical protein
MTCGLRGFASSCQNKYTSRVSGTRLWPYEDVVGHVEICLCFFLHCQVNGKAVGASAERYFPVEYMSESCGSSKARVLSNGKLHHAARCGVQPKRPAVQVV